MVSGAVGEFEEWFVFVEIFQMLVVEVPVVVIEILLKAAVA